MFDSLSAGIVLCNLWIIRYRRCVSISFSDSVKIPDDVLISNLQDESVILNLDSERYYGLDSVGTRILSVLTTSDSIEAAYNTLIQEYDVDDQVLRVDLLALVEDLVD